MAKNQMTRILSNLPFYIRKTYGANGVLASLFRKMMYDIGMTNARWDVLMTEFINDVQNGVPGTQKDRTSMRGNLTKEFGRPQMTWKVFCKGLRFLQMREFEVVIRAKGPTGRVDEHTTGWIDLGRRQDVNKLLGTLDTPDVQDENQADQQQDAAMAEEDRANERAVDTSQKDPQQ